MFETSATSIIERRSYSGLEKIAKKLVSGEFKQTVENVEIIIRGLENRGCSRVLVAGGGAIGQGMKKLYESEKLEIISFDIYSNELVQFVADGHDIQKWPPKLAGCLSASRCYAAILAAD